MKLYLLVIALLILVGIYMLSGCSLSCSEKRDNFTEPKDACAYLAQDGYSKDFVKSCYDYMKICGNGSGAAEALSMSEMYETFDAKAGEAAYAAEVARVSSNKSQCMPPMPCGSMSDPAGQTYTYDEDSGQYIPDSSVRVQTPCPSFLGCSNLDTNGVGVCQ
jgi:hypothetical protein